MKERLTSASKPSIGLEVVGGASVVGNDESVRTMGHAPFVAVFANGTRCTMLALSVTKDAGGAAGVEL